MKLNTNFLKLAGLILLVFLIDMTMKFNQEDTHLKILQEIIKEQKKEPKEAPLKVRKKKHKRSKERTPRKVSEKTPENDPSPSPSINLPPVSPKNPVSSKTRVILKTLEVDQESFLVKMIQNGVINPKVTRSGRFLVLSGKKKVFSLVPITFELKGTFYRDFQSIKFLVNSVSLNGTPNSGLITEANERINKYLVFVDKGY